MLTATILVVGALAYMAGGAWVWGYSCARFAVSHNCKPRNRWDEERSPSYYHDEPEPFIAAILWPCYISYLLLSSILGSSVKFIVKSGSKVGEKYYADTKLRIESEKKVRVEVDAIEVAAKKEVEELLEDDEGEDDGDDDEEYEYDTYLHRR